MAVRYYAGITMPTITVKLDKERAARLARWAKRKKASKSDVIRALIDRAGPIETGDDLAEWVKASQGKGLGFGQSKS
jgi:ribbon-helix-helix CopG family protein